MTERKKLRSAEIDSVSRMSGNKRLDLIKLSIYVGSTL